MIKAKKDDFSQFRKRIDSTLVSHIRADYAHLEHMGYRSKEFVTLFLSHFEQYLTAGKRVRATLIPYIQYLYGNTYTQQSVALGSMMEYLQAFLLIHDDIMDDDPKRRGMASMHDFFSKTLSGVSSTTSSGDSFASVKKPTEDSMPESASQLVGNNLAICLGDICFSFCYYLLGNIENLKNVKVINTLVSKSIVEVGFAQSLDVLWGYGTTMPPFESIIDMYRGKTGSYTFALPLQLAVCISDIDNSLLSDELLRIKIIGEELGVVFQMEDDIMNLCYDESLTGKKRFSDLKEKKKTVCATLLFEEATHHNRIEEVARLFYAGDVCERVYEFITSWGIIEKIQSSIYERAQTINREISQLHISPESRSALEKLVQGLTTRLAKFEAKKANVQ